MTLELTVNPILCDAHGHCAELLPQLIHRDEWGYPILESRTVPAELAADARRAAASCPRMALLLEQRVSR